MTPFQLKAWSIPLAASLVVAAVGWWADRALERSMQTELRDELQTILDADVNALRIWLASHRSTAVAVAGSPPVRAVVADLARRSAQGASPDALRSAPSARELAALLQPVVAEFGYTNWAVLSPSIRTLASDLTDMVGLTVLADRPGLREVLGDSTVVAAPYRRPSAVPGDTTSIAEPGMFVATPVRNDAGQVIAGLGFRISPADFTDILTVARMGWSGETYAFDERGLMLSYSRFDDDLRRIGLLPSDTSVRSILNIEIRDPGGNMLTGYRPATPRRGQPLTRMAADAIMGRQGIDVAGYNDYRGVPVVGAWTWLPELNVGVTTEVDVVEAYATLFALKRGFWALLGLLIAGAAGMFVYSMVIVRLRRKVRTAQRLGQYKLQKKIGEGGMGKVYLAKHSMLRRPTAVKLIRSDDATQHQIARFEREVRYTSYLTHPNTIAIYDFGRTPEGVFYYAMEYLEGLTLGTLVGDGGPIPEGRVIHILRQVCGSLGEAHATGLIHRDIKPANIVLTKRGGLYDFVKVLDFGLVRQIDQSDTVALTEVGSITGTPLYLSPESLQSPEAMDGRSDLYAVGAVGYYLLTGEPVFLGKSAIEVASQHLHSKPTRPSTRLGQPISADIEDVVLHCLQKEPRLRPADAYELLAELVACQSADKWSQTDARTWWDTLDTDQSKEAWHLDFEAGRTPTTRSEPPTLDVDLDRRQRRSDSLTS